jgi:excisionase family DNA binding protein
MTAPDVPVWLTADDVASRWGISRKTVYALVRTGKIPAHRLPGGTYLRFRADQLDAAMQEVGR